MTAYPALRVGMRGKYPFVPIRVERDTDKPHVVGAILKETSMCSVLLAGRRVKNVT